MELCGILEAPRRRPIFIEIVLHRHWTTATASYPWGLPQNASISEVECLVNDIDDHKCSVAWSSTYWAIAYHCIVFTTDSRSIWSTLPRSAHLCGQKSLRKFEKFRWKLCRERRRLTSTRLGRGVFVELALSEPYLILMGQASSGDTVDATRGQCAAPLSFACSNYWLQVCLLNPSNNFLVSFNGLKLGRKRSSNASDVWGTMLHVHIDY